MSGRANDQVESPGSWAVEKWAHGYAIVAEGDYDSDHEFEDGDIVATVDGNRPKDAALLAAAPALLAALRACIAAHETGLFEPARAAYENAKNVVADMSGNREGERNG